MSGGPQVFLGTTTFYLISGCRQISGHREACPLGAGLLVAPRVFRAPEAPAAREARRPHFVRRRASKPARALRSLRRPPHQWGQAQPPPMGAATRPRGARGDPIRSAWLLSNLARNSPASISNIDIASLELQRFERGSKTDRCKLRATFARGYVVAAAHRKRDPAQRDPARRLNCAPKLGRV